MGIFQNDYFSSPTTGNIRGFFLVLRFDSIVEVKTTKYGGPLRLSPHEFLSLELFHIQPLPIHQNVPCKFEKHVYCAMIE